MSPRLPANASPPARLPHKRGKLLPASDQSFATFRPIAGLYCRVSRPYPQFPRRREAGMQRAN
jgi:hypothetical protein